MRAVSVNGVVCKGQTREEINLAISQSQSEEQDIVLLFQCFCLCHDMNVIKSQEDGELTFDGNSQDEQILLQLAQQSSFFGLIARD